MKNPVVFDMGNVLLRFETQRAAADFTDNEEDAAAFHKGVFEGPWWHAMDRGVDERVCAAGMQSLLPERLRGGVTELLAVWDDYLVPVPETNRLAEELLDAGHPLYLLSNAPPRFLQFRRKLPVLERFSGLVISFQEGLIKPDPALYRVLLARYGLDPGRCFFIDDSPMNVESARHVGLIAHWFQQGMDVLRADLRAWGADIGSLVADSQIL